MRIPLENKKWPEIRAFIDQGNPAYYIERDGFYTVVVPDALAQCEMPMPNTFDTLSDDVKAFFSQKHVLDFEEIYKPKTLRSALSEPATPMNVADAG